MSFHLDRVHDDPQLAANVTWALLAELGRVSLEVGRLRVITYIDNKVESRYL
jgi:hypothetical protein